MNGAAPQLNTTRTTHTTHTMNTMNTTAARHPRTCIVHHSAFLAAGGWSELRDFPSASAEAAAENEEGAIVLPLRPGDDGPAILRAAEERHAQAAADAAENREIKRAADCARGLWRPA